MSEQSESQPEPGWRQSPATEEELYESTTRESGRQWSPTKSSEADPAIPDSIPESAVERLRRTSSSPASSDALEGLLAEGLQLLSGLATLVTRRNLNLDVRMMPREAAGAAKPIARLIARRFQIRRELSDATDAVGAGASLADYAGRIMFTMPAPPPPDRRVAQAPAPTSAPISEERSYEYVAQPAPAPQSFAASQPAVRDQGGNAVPGSGPVKTAFLDGFDE
jgi:hypothetical protein